MIAATAPMARIAAASLVRCPRTGVRILRARCLPVPPCAISLNQDHRALCPWCFASQARPAVHDPGLAKVLAPWRNAATAAGLLMLKSWLMEFVESNHTNPSNPYA